jgi:hypothetical protein
VSQQSATPADPLRAAPPGHDAAMIAKVDAKAAAIQAELGGNPNGTPAGQVTPPADGAKQRPDNVPEKFWDAAKGVVNVEAMLKSHSELEKKLGAGPAAGTPDAMQAAQAAVTAAKLDMGTLTQEFAKDGKLGDASYAALAAAGIDKAVVDQFIAGQMAVAKSAEVALMDSVGGEAAWNSMAAWANANLQASDHEAFNAAVNKGGDTAKLAMAGLKAKYEAANGVQPKLVSGAAAAGNTGVQPFASRAEVTEAMRNPKYRSDPAYRANVIARIDAMEVF